MNTTISFEPDTLHVEENLLEEILRGVKGVGIAELTSVDVVRHEVVSRIVDAYERYEEAK